MLRAELFELLAGAAPAQLAAGVADDESLIRSGRVDSTVLFQVALWVEERVGRRLDLAAFDLREEWDSVRAILDFVERHRA